MLRPSGMKEVEQLGNEKVVVAFRSSDSGQVRNPMPGTAEADGEMQFQ